jgi:cytoplasmic tRNA 2-thiolation protein 2
MAACGGAGCGPQCSSSSSAGGQEDALVESMGRLSTASAAAACGKCDGGGAAVAVAGGVGMCAGCFRAHLFGKFKLSVTSNAMVRPTDAVLLAFSGGPASRFPHFSLFLPPVLSTG